MNNPFNFFDKIFCINLERRPDRWSICKTVFQYLDIESNVERLNAFDANNFTAENNIPLQEKGRFACALSHINAIKLAKERQYKNILVFEDDINLHTNKQLTTDTLQLCIQQLPPDWEIFYLSANPLGNDPYESLENYSENLCLVTQAFTTHAIALNSSIYDIILENFKNGNDLHSVLRTLVAIDGFYIHSILSRRKSFMPKKLLFTQRHDFSDIDRCERNINQIIIDTYTRKHLLVP